MRLIDADKLKQHYAWWPENERTVLDQIVDAQPTVDTVVHGEWIGKSEADSTPFCSICGRMRLGSSLVFVKKYVPYCEYCGAKMDGGAK